MYRELSDRAKRYDNTPNIVYVVDNDQAGKEFLDKHLFNNLITDYKGGDIKYFVSILPKGKEVKDWNDLLKLKNGRAFEPDERSKIWSKTAYKKLQNIKELEL